MSRKYFPPSDVLCLYNDILYDPLPSDEGDGGECGSVEADLKRSRNRIMFKLREIANRTREEKRVCREKALKNISSSIGEMSGIIIEEDRVERISGPVAYRYLIPIDGNLPIQLMFADVHHSTENSCERCDSNNNCHMIYGKSLLKLIDKLAEEYPIDFYTESSKYMLTMDDRQGQGYLFEYLLEETKDCYDPKARKNYRYEIDCPTKFIRWHYSDVRYFKSVEGYMYDYVRKFCKLQKKKFDQEKRVVDSWKENYIVLSRDNPFNADITNKGNNMITKLLELLVEFAKKPNVPYSHTVYKIGKMYIENLYDYSSVYKQIKDIEIEEEGWINIFTLDKQFETYLKVLKGKAGYLRLIEYLIFDKLEDTINKGVFKKTIQHFFHLYPNIDMDEEKDFKETLISFNAISMLVHGKLLDLYYIGRMLKTPSNNLNSYLSISYFGKNHTDSITKFLAKVFGYEERYAQENPQNSYRCVRFQNKIDLSRDLKEHARKRAASPDFLNFHKITIDIEKAMRQESRNKSFYFDDEKE